MALITHMKKGEKDRQSIHDTTECLYYIIRDSENRKYLQINTFGSEKRKDKGTVSQSIQFSPEAIEKLKEIINNL
jgi:hypothetical protein